MDHQQAPSSSGLSAEDFRSKQTFFYAEVHLVLQIRTLMYLTLTTISTLLSSLLV